MYVVKLAIIKGPVVTSYSYVHKGGVVQQHACGAEKDWQNLENVFIIALM